ncbi:MAG: hypothetical protein J6U98_01740 [Abditibacteriota bacterium]|nr:hypothetical protein [Abditibacteriota bacterium]MBP5739138.1 hypothetical protein [Abditibacteriota bacterium]
MKKILSIVLILSAAVILLVTGLLLNSDHKDKNANVDLSVLNDGMAYSEVCYIAERPAEYKGKKIKMKGTLTEIPDKDKVHYLCVVGDSAGCCAQGLEFELAEGEDPGNKKEITILGTFDTYKIMNDEFIILRNTKIIEEKK